MSAEKNKAIVPDGYVRLEGSERRAPSKAKLVGQVDDNERFKVTISLRRRKEEAIDEDAERLWAVLSASAAPELGDASSPERIRAVVGLSKKAFKRAAGRLLKTGRARIDDAGWLRAR